MQIDTYQVIDKLGEGSMGKVFLVKAPGESNYYALKILLAEKSYETRYHRFMREIRALTMLDHPHIVKVYKSGKHDDIPYYLMEYVEGDTLSDYLKKVGKKAVTLDLSLHLIDQIAAALDYLHDRNIVHRDLKPSNIMLTHDNTVKLTDFGLVKIIGQEESMMTETGTIIGTVKYMSPEQALGKKIDSRTDIYSLGILFYLLTTGSLPFIDDDPISLLWKIIQSETDPPHLKNPSIPTPISKLISRMIAKNPDDRYPSARSVINELLRLEQLDEQPTITALNNRSAELIVDEDIQAIETIHYCFQSQYFERSEEFKKINKWIDDSRSPLLVTVTGPEGIGKTRFVQEFARQVSQTEFDVIIGQHHGDGKSSYPILTDLIYNLRSFITMKYGDEGKELSKELTFDRYAREMFFLHDTHSSFLKPRDFKGTVYQWEMKRRKYTFWQSILHVFIQILERSPLVLILEDMHRGSVEEWQFIRFLLLSLKEIGLKRPNLKKLFAIATIQQEDFLESSDSLEYLNKLVELDFVKCLPFHPFSYSETKIFIHSLLGVQTSVDLFIKRIHKITQGNPFFIEELTRHLVHQQCLKRHNSTLTTADDDPSESSWGELPIPDNLYNIVLQNISDLPKEYQWYLKIASVAGYQFDFETILHISEHSPNNLLDGFQKLIYYQIINEHPNRETIYYFRHPLIQEIVYTSLDFEERKLLHEKIGQYLQLQYKNNEEVLPQEIAYHFGQCGRYCEASVASSLAAVNDYQVKASNQARKLMDKALTAFSTFEQTCEQSLPKNEVLRLKANLFEKSGFYRLFTGELNRARKDFEIVLDISELLRDSRMKAKAMNRLAETALYLNQTDRAISMLQESDSILAENNDRYEMKKNKELFGKVFLLLGNCEAAIESFNQVLEFQQYLPPNTVSYVTDLCNLALLYEGKSNYNKALEYYRKAFYLFQKENKQDYLHEPLRRIRHLLYQTQQISECRECTTKLLEIGWTSVNFLELILTYHDFACYDLSQNDSEKVEDAAQKLAWILDDCDLLLS